MVWTNCVKIWTGLCGNEFEYKSSFVLLHFHDELKVFKQYENTCSALLLHCRALCKQNTWTDPRVSGLDSLANHDYQPLAKQISSPQVNTCSPVWVSRTSMILAVGIEVRSCTHAPWERGRQSPDLVSLWVKWEPGSVATIYKHYIYIHLVSATHHLCCLQKYERGNRDHQVLDPRSFLTTSQGLNRSNRLRHKEAVKTRCWLEGRENRDHLHPTHSPNRLCTPTWNTTYVH